MTSSRKVGNRFGYSKKETKENLGGWNNLEKLQELFTDRVNNTLWATKKHFYDKFEVEQNLNRLDMLKQFVKFLVDNDKIDLDMIPNVFTSSAQDRDEVYYCMRDIKDFSILNEQYWKPTIECLFMLLSIQDNPIEFLISVLK